MDYFLKINPSRYVYDNFCFLSSMYYFVDKIKKIKLNTLFLSFTIISILLILFHFHKNDEKHINMNMNSKIDFRNEKKEKKSKIPIHIYRIDDSLNTNASSLQLSHVMTEIMHHFPIYFKFSSFYKANCIMFETVNFVENTLETLKLSQNVHYINAIKGIDLLASKSIFAHIMNKFSKDVIPKTYVFSHKDDLHRLIREYSKDTLYILKKNIQRQEGLILSDSLMDIMKTNEKDKSYIICQKILRDPYLISERKINMRVYLLITIDNDLIKWYIYNNGFIYYTPEKYDPLSNDSQKIITTGYIDRKVYDENPMTFDELEKYIGFDDYNYLMKNIYESFSHIKEAYSNNLFSLNRNLPGIKFTLMGCDIAPDNALKVKVLEINKGPDVMYKDERDKKVKYNLVLDMFEKIGIIDKDAIQKKYPQKKNGFKIVK